MGRSRLYRRGAVLAVLADGGGFWLCRATADVWLEADAFSACWLEQAEQAGVYKKENSVVRLHLGSIISKVTMLPESKGLLRLPEREKLRLERMLQKLQDGFKLHAYEKDHDQVRTIDVVLMEKEGYELDKKKNGTKRKMVSQKIKTPNKKAKISETVKGKNKSVKSNTKKVTAKKPPKPKVDKTNPNWRLIPNTKAPGWESDPLFNTKTTIPFVSSLSQSKLVIRAVLTKDIKLLQKCVKNTEEIFSLHTKRSLGNSMTALQYAIKEQNTAAIKLLVKGSGKNVTRCSPPRCLLPTQGTGTYNYRSLGIKKIRKLNMSRGSREGNNAFTKDQASEALENNSMSDSDTVASILKWNLPIKFITELYHLLPDLSQQSFVNKVARAVQHGRRELAAYFIERELAQGGQAQFSKFHVEALKGTGDPWKQTVRGC